MQTLGYEPKDKKNSMRNSLLVVCIFFCLKTFGQIDVKQIDRSMAKISGSLYASKFEVSNNNYREFLTALIKENRMSELSIAQIDTLKWNDNISTYSNNPYVDYYHKHPAYNDYPVVNVSYEAAQMYCEWLTLTYNSSPNRKFNKVKFRLPSESEWEIAAKGGDSLAKYPWKGEFLKSKKGHYLCNFAREAKDSMGIANKLNDSADITAPVNSYYPNHFGLFNLSGNIAEMISDKQFVKGGSWQSTPENLTITSKQSNDGNSKPTVGFRIFMDVIGK
jgi:formylglycine-generating enzyme required for sulfatase activity